MNGDNKTREDVITRLRFNERECMMQLALAEDFVAKAKRILDRRLMVVERGHNRIAIALSCLRKLNLDLYGTVPAEQLLAFKRNIEQVAYIVGTRIADKEERNSEFGIWLSFDTLNEIIPAVKDHCLMCNKDRQQERSCKLAKALDNIGNNLEERPGGGCKYRGVL